MNCVSLPADLGSRDAGTSSAEVLWDLESHGYRFWKGSKNVFSGCSDELRAMVPVSWGGTMQ